MTAASQPTTEVMPALGLLATRCGSWAPSVSLLTTPPPGDVVLVDARHTLAEARSLCRLLHATGVAVPLLAVLTEGGLVALSRRLGRRRRAARHRRARPRSRPGCGWRSAGGPRRTRRAEGGVIRAGDLTIDETTYTAKLRGRPLDLTYKEFELLKFLAQHPGRVFTRDQLLQEVWGYDYFGGTRTVDVHVRRLRAKLGAEHESMIGTVRKVGYKFVQQPPADATAAAARPADRRASVDAELVLTRVRAARPGRDARTRPTVVGARWPPRRGGRRRPPRSPSTVLTRPGTADAGRHPLATARRHALVGYAHLDDRRRRARRAPRRTAGGASAAALLDRGSSRPGPARVWAHGDQPAAPRCAAARGCDRARACSGRLRRPLADVIPDRARLPDGVTLRPFVPGPDEDAWLAVNARAFAAPPRAGPLDRPRTCGCARPSRGSTRPASCSPAATTARCSASTGPRCTRRRRRPPIGEVYVLGVDPAAQGAAARAGADRRRPAHLRDRGLAEVMLYVDEDNAGRGRLYERLGFTDGTPTCSSAVPDRRPARSPGRQPAATSRSARGANLFRLSSPALVRSATFRPYRRLRRRRHAGGTCPGRLPAGRDTGDPRRDAR